MDALRGQVRLSQDPYRTFVGPFGFSARRPPVPALGNSREVRVQNVLEPIVYGHLLLSSRCRDAKRCDARIWANKEMESFCFTKTAGRVFVQKLRLNFCIFAFVENRRDYPIPDGRGAHGDLLTSLQPTLNVRNRLIRRRIRASRLLGHPGAPFS